MDKPEFAPLIASTSAERNPEVSPDGKWLAYESFESTPPQIYVRPFPDVNGGRWQISKDGGIKPVWSPNGRELFFLSGSDGRTVSLYAVAIPTTPIERRESGEAVRRSEPARPAERPLLRRLAQTAKFIVIKSPAAKDQPGRRTQTLVVVANWFEELKAKVGGR